MLRMLCLYFNMTRMLLLLCSPNSYASFR
uniref:Uncharacterized protein n=1 Tax=Anguilla anguilla TaxID=7936 RepID=A0A0E9QBX6_ANGAN